MGDRCYSHVTTKKEHLELFDKIGYYLEEDLGNDTVELVDEEANYANYNCLMELEGIVFIAWNGSGGEYGEASQVSDGKTTLEANFLHDGVGPTIEVGEDGEVHQDQLKQARDFIRLRKEVEGILGTSSEELK